jgi:hypothetical protein
MKAFLILTFFLLFLVAITFYPFTLEKNIEIVTYDKMYACNECNRSYGILEVKKGEKIKQFLNQDLPTFYQNEKLEKNN